MLLLLLPGEIARAPSCLVPEEVEASKALERYYGNSGDNGVLEPQWKIQYIFKTRMWDQGGQPWQQWPLNQQQWMQSFQHQQDPSQIDWAALAQAWIAQREASGQQSMVEQPPGMMPNGQDMSAMESGPNNHGNFQGDSNFNRMWQPG
ncbi:arginine/serine-rich protein PNISR isoform X3 [Pteronotus mesoamericanus]|nr:arginine/serine-rich protein PNISR isoform X3 [Pteronotus parnellii mesoamericanus]